MRVLLIATALAIPGATYAEQTGGTATEAKAMLLKAASAIKADREVALAQFNKGEPDSVIVTCMSSANGQQTENLSPVR
jgi:hypothetical protein